MNSQSYIFLGYGLSDVLKKKIVIFGIFVAFPTFEFFLKAGGSVYVPKNHIRWIAGEFGFSLSVRHLLIKPALQDNCCIWGTPILHDDTQKFNGVPVFTDHFFFRCKVLDIKLSWVFRFGYVQFDNWHCGVYHWKWLYWINWKLLLLRNELS